MTFLLVFSRQLEKEIVKDVELSGNFGNFFIVESLAIFVINSLREFFFSKYRGRVNNSTVLFTFSFVSLSYICC